MRIRLLLAAPDDESIDLLQTLLAEAAQLLPFDVAGAVVQGRDALIARARQRQDDVVLLDWSMGGAGSPELVRELLQINPTLRLMVLLPTHLRQYRMQIWQAGACSSIPKERLDQEWLSSALCIMHRAMEREVRMRASLQHEGAL